MVQWWYQWKLYWVGDVCYGNYWETQLWFFLLGCKPTTNNMLRWSLMFVCLFLFYAIATVFQFYHGSYMMYEMRRRKPESTLLPTQGIFNHPNHIGMVWEELAVDDAVSYTLWGNGLKHINVIAVTRIRTPVHRVTYPAL